ncbi:glycosyltransferase family 4 protein [Hyphomicrobium sp.]|uniref:glycosyltransferase family 4 protein n=1 Tax=Hyphomicrobium sp. TaxID=82 RepID=UPI000FA659B5|nr:glycosyltransferase family 4 protein [Hyphomicrobium sp.]RUP09851.1 MAG: glycosyltransferase [Hyphomicrobium sp.]
MRILTCLGDATSIVTWSNTPYFLLKAGQSAGFLDDGWRLDTRVLRYHRLAWNAARTMKRLEMGGFQYSPSFLRRLIAQVRPIDFETEVISHFPLFPPLGSGVRRTSYYIDATLAQNFGDYGLAGRGGVGKAMAADAIARERDQYEAAERIVCMSRWAARSVVERYGISGRKVHVVPPGANLPPDEGPAFAAKHGGPLVTLRLGFIGKDWRRKNLPFLLQIADALHARRVPVEIAAAGFDPAAGPRHHLMKAVGFIDKRHDMAKFVRFIRSCHFICLFSNAEALGVSNRESLRLGVPVLARNIGGIADSMPEGCGLLFEPSAQPEDVANAIETYVLNPDRYWVLRVSVAARSEEFSWATAVRKLQAIWSGSDQYAYERLKSYA